MPHVLLHSSTTCDVYHDQEIAWLYLDWKGPQELPAVQAVGQQLLGLIQQTGVRKALNDNAHITKTNWELVRWVAYDYLPVAGQAGIHCVAWVQSPLLACRSNINLMTFLPDQKPQIAAFDEMAAACTWLRNANMALDR